jgi:hypothetical protein
LFSPGLTVSAHTRKLAMQLQEAVLWHFHPGAEARAEDPDTYEGGHEQRDGQYDEVDAHELSSDYRDGDAGWYSDRT